MSTETSRPAQEHEFAEVDVTVDVSKHHLMVSDLKNVKLTITADLGKTSMLVRDVLELRRGSVIQLDKLAGEMTDVFVNDKPLARAEVVVIADGLHVRIGELVGYDEKIGPDDRK